MPVYEYARISDAQCEECESGFDTIQKIADTPLNECPSCGAPVKRIISAPAISKSTPSLSQKNLEQHGFSQYRKAGDGVYEKTAGKGPATLKK